MLPARPNVTHYIRQIERIEQSPHLRQSESLRRLLRYLGERSLAGEGEQLKEYIVGVEALGRAADYDPQTDSSVRVQMSRLRAKLAQYYLEAADDPIFVSIPKGGFVVRFEPRASPAAAAPELLPPAPADRRLAYWRAAAIGAAAAAIFLGVTAAIARAPAAAIDADVAALWAPYLTEARSTSICIGIPLFLQVRPKDSSLPYELTVRQPDFNEWDPQAAVERMGPWRGVMSPEPPTPFWNFMGVGEGLGAFHLANVLARAGVGLKAVRGHVASWDDLSADNVIYLGGPKFNPRLREIPASEHFIVHAGRIDNVAPRQGEPSVFPVVAVDARQGACAVVSRRRKSNGEGVVTAIGSPSSLATWAAAEYMTRPAHARRLAAELRAAYGAVPEEFEAVIRGRFVDGFPVEIDHVAHRRVERAATSAPVNPPPAAR